MEFNKDNRIQTEEHELYGTLGCISFGSRLEYVREEYQLTKSTVACKERLNGTAVSL